MQTYLFDLEIQVKAKVTVKKAPQPKEEDVDWGDIYDEYPDFNCTAKVWH